MSNAALHRADRGIKLVITLLDPVHRKYERTLKESLDAIHSEDGKSKGEDGTHGDISNDLA